MQKESVQSLGLLFIAVAFLSSFYFFGLYRQQRIETENARVLSEQIKERSALFESLSIVAPTVLVYDSTTDVILYAKNPFEPKPLASLAKIATAFTLLETGDVSGELLSDDNITDTFGETQFLSGENLNTTDLLDILLVTSSNHAAEMLTDSPPTISYFPRLKFKNTSGLDIEIQGNKIPGATGSAYDIARLGERFVTKYPERALATTREFTDIVIGTRIYHAQNTNEWISKMPDLAISKTGYTDLAGGNLLVGYYTKDKHLIIIVVLGSTKEGRFKDVELLLETTRILFP
jgi:D-alanyl-D-alanine carboxypeptidase